MLTRPSLCALAAAATWFAVSAARWAAAASSCAFWVLADALGLLDPPPPPLLSLPLPG
ncbi:hypothetical protein [Streptomyces sp. NPDC049040]|uniref:hypothetical protein n=1 Tax=Streptomyces sp. NPDC049040 TaxID=3365593 RepID=UPI003711378E